MNKEKSFYVYLHLKPGGEPFYVGKGSDGVAHSRRCYDFKHQRNPHFANVVRKYGKENIEVLVFPRETEIAAFDDEKKWIKVLRESGYKITNITDGGDGFCGGRHTPESRAKIGAAAKGNKYTLGKKMPEHVRKMHSIRSKGNKYRLGIPDTEETKKKKSISAFKGWIKRRERQSLSA